MLVVCVVPICELEDRVALCRQSALAVLVLLRERLPAELCLPLARLVYASRAEHAVWGRLRLPVACDPMSRVVDVARALGLGQEVFSPRRGAWLDGDATLRAAGVAAGEELLVQRRHVRLRLRWYGTAVAAQFGSAESVARVRAEVRRIAGRSCARVAALGLGPLADSFPLALLEEDTELDCELAPRP